MLKGFLKKFKKRHTKPMIPKSFIDSLQLKLNIAPELKTLGDLTHHYALFEDPSFYTAEDLLVYYGSDKDLKELYKELKNT